MIRSFEVFNSSNKYGILSVSKANAFQNEPFITKYSRTNDLLNMLSGISSPDRKM